MNIEAIAHAIEHGENEDATRSKTISLFAGWVQGAYGSGPDTNMFIIVPRTTDGTVMLEGNYTRVLDFFANLGESQGVSVLEATLEYIRKGMPINLEAFTLPWVTIGPLGERTLYVFDKDTMYKQRCTLKNVCDPNGRRVCAVSTTNKGAIFPRNAFTSRPPNHTFFNPRFLVSRIAHLRLWASSFNAGNQGDLYRGTITECEQILCRPGGLCSPLVIVYTLRAVVLIPKDRMRCALHFEKEIIDAISSLKRMELPALDGPGWQLPTCLKGFPIEADCVHLLEILDISITQRNFKVWEEVMEILPRFKTVNEIGRSRIFSAIKEFSFKKVQPLWVPSSGIGEHS